MTPSSIRLCLEAFNGRLVYCARKLTFWGVQFFGARSREIREYIKIFYNRQRIQGRLGYLSPTAYETEVLTGREAPHEIPDAHH